MAALVLEAGTAGAARTAWGVGNDWLLGLHGAGLVLLGVAQHLHRTAQGDEGPVAVTVVRGAEFEVRLGTERGLACLAFGDAGHAAEDFAIKDGSESVGYRSLEHRGS